MSVCFCLSCDLVSLRAREKCSPRVDKESNTVYLRSGMSPRALGKDQNSSVIYLMWTNTLSTTVFEIEVCSFICNMQSKHYLQQVCEASAQTVALVPFSWPRSRRETLILIGVISFDGVSPRALSSNGWTDSVSWRETQQMHGVI